MELDWLRSAYRRHDPAQEVQVQTYNPTSCKKSIKGLIGLSTPDMLAMFSNRSSCRYARHILSNLVPKFVTHHWHLSNACPWHLFWASRMHLQPCQGLEIQKWRVC